LNLFSQYENYSNLQIALEIIAVIFGIISVLCIKNKNILGYPTGIINTSIYTYLLYDWGLFGEMGINFYYTIMSIYGWFMWNKTQENEHNYTITKLNLKETKNIVIAFILAFFGTILIYYWKNNYLNPISTNFMFNFQGIDFIDALTTALFLVGMYLMAKIKLENWLFWILGNLIAIPLYHIKGYDITALQYVMFLILAIFSYLDWKNQFQKMQKSE